MKIYRRLVTNKNFWGFVKMKGDGWRFGFGYGFFEWGKNTSPGIWLLSPEYNKRGEK